ncbi:hypothetical protein EVC30_126 [Rhizobium phage RHph_Y1_11]|nr:hypothetical protein EVC30_126 [Rhizobium phage RHph_Y1_11]
MAIEVLEKVLEALGHSLDAVTSESKQEAINRQNAILADPTSRSRLAADRLLNIR